MGFGGIMTTLSRTIALLLLAALSGCAMSDRPSAVSYENTHQYRLGAGDQVRVVVFDQPSLSASYTVDASGAVSIPLAGRLKAESRTVRQLEGAIGSALKDKGLVADPKVTVEVLVYRPFSILGEVRAPGRFPYAPGMTIEDAIALAGGYTIHAEQNAVRVTTRNGDAQITDFRPPTASFFAGDALYVPERWF
jgi:polysaccharide biosynthesis/export protein